MVFCSLFLFVCVLFSIVVCCVSLRRGKKWFDLCTTCSGRKGFWGKEKRRNNVVRKVNKENMGFKNRKREISTKPKKKKRMWAQYINRCLMVFAFLFKDAHCIFHVFLSVFLFFPKRPATFSHLFPSLGFVDASRQCEPKALIFPHPLFSLVFSSSCTSPKATSFLLCECAREGARCLFTHFFFLCFPSRNLYGK